MTTYSDDFNRADSSNLGAGWVEVSGDWSIISNQLSPGAAGGTVLLRNAGASSTNNNYAQAKLAVAATASQGVVCRGNANFSNGYLWRNDGSQWDLFSIVGGSFSNIGTFAGAAVNGDVAKVQANGSTIKAFVNGVERVSVTDTAVATGTAIGIRSESAGTIRWDDFIGGDLSSVVNGTMDLPGGAGAATLTGSRTVHATMAAAGGAGTAALAGQRTVNASAALAGGAGAAALTAGRTVHGSGALPGGAGALHLTGGLGGELKHANTTLVALAWLRSLAGVPLDAGGNKAVATTLPALAKWATSGFITLGPIFGSTDELYVPLKHPVVQLDFWAVNATSKHPDYGLANELAEIVREAIDLTTFDGVPEIVMPTAVRPVWLSSIYAVSGVQNIPDPNNYAHYTMDVHIGWIEREALAGVTG